VIMREQVKGRLFFDSENSQIEAFSISSSLQQRAKGPFLEIVRDLFKSFEENFTTGALDLPMECGDMAMMKTFQRHDYRKITCEEGREIVIRLKIPPKLADVIDQRHSDKKKKGAGVRPGAHPNKPRKQRFNRSKELPRIKAAIRSLWGEGKSADEITQKLVAKSLNLSGPETGADALRKRLKQCGVSVKWSKFVADVLSEPESNYPIN
jgi:hypothetical protein